ncbi:DNA double-strand break repair ATPase Rad50 [Halobacteria archaeon AArc-m2/3/4]|uniref:DNA double-strand break repair Rad50 ATPase n=1 Tax=Natronoglomus mannanivorans TaxID=2979990 RepID=A0ABT2Q9U4_9EURY|nr:DNA double-strand break repair ATPase Rad50 [Halobacteria archaeon AArc-m2/3/4]
MRVERIRLRNFKCYGDADLSLHHGVTVVHGVNGSGKSTLLEAVFFALYGSKALDDRTLDDVITTGEEEAEVELAFTHDGGDYRIERHLKLRGDRATTTKCVLETGTETVEGARDVRREVTELLRMDADAFVNCAYVRQGEVNKLIHASPSDRQDMIDDLLQLGALEEYRERASDARLGVKTVLDGQREVRENLREQVETKEDKDLHERLNGLESKHTEVTEQIEHYESQRDEAERTLETAEDVLERHEETREEMADLAEEIEALRSTITETEGEREDLKERIRVRREECEEYEDERAAVLSELEVGASLELELDVGVDVDVNLERETETDSDPTTDLDPTTSNETVEELIDRLEAQDEALREGLEELRLAIQEHTGEVTRLRERAEELESEAERKRADADELAETLAEDESTIEEREATVEELAEKIETRRSEFDDAPVAFGEAADHREELANEREELRSELADVSATIDATTASIEEGEELLEAGKCPECGQPVEDSPHVDVLAERREELADFEERQEELQAELEIVAERLERAEELCEAEREVEQLETNRENVEQLLAEKRETLSQRREQRDDLRQRAEDLEADAEEKRADADEIETTADERRSELGEINGARSGLKETLGQLRRVSELATEIESLESDIEADRERRANKAELNDERRNRLSDKRERKRELEDEFDEDRIEQARSERENAAEYIEQVEAELETLLDRRTNLQNAIGAVENELEELETLRERLEDVDARCSDLESLYEEAETLQATYGDLRTELRQRNVETLERLLNETFDLVYQNDSYASIDLDGEYRLTVYQKDGEPLEPEQLSGGERALFNLSLRCAIYRLLAEGVEGTAPMPPLILDEPTVFLDSGHVTQLVSLVESMRDLGVEQIVVVSHDEELVGAADDLVRVEKDSTSNRSRLERGEPPEATLLASD